MEEEKKKKISLPTFLFVLALLVIIVLALLIYMQKVNAEKEVVALKNDADQLKAKVTELQSKLDNTLNIANSQDSTEKNNTNEKEMDTSNKTNNELNAKTEETKEVKSDENINKIVGSWKLFKIFDKGVEEYDYKVIFGSAGLGRGLILKEDKTFIDEVGNAMSSQDTIKGTYEVNGNDIILTFSNGVIKKLKYDAQSETIDFQEYLTDCRLILKK